VETKGNLGPLGVGGSFRDTLGTIFLIYACHIGQNTNNGAELTTMVKGLKLGDKYGFNNLIVEGDSRIPIHTLIKLLCGTKLEKTSQNWFLSIGIKQVSKLVNFMSSITPSCM